ncbi:uncharacterized protein LOC143808889 isoform X3 [Ranitomeya variabilis]|uniref:uncharacterized protein LOC143808889 isoform X3 n=1 Tax=Ranitomeya variabilis TaxID=490064 RepID=UPI004055DC4E
MALQVINLSNHNLTLVELSVLQKGLSFVPTHSVDKFTLIKDLYLLCRKLTFQVMYNKPDVLHTMSLDERRTFQDLLELLEENESGLDRRRFPHRNKSLRTPSFSLVPAIKIFFEVVKRDILSMPIRLLCRALQLSIITQQEKQYLWVANPVTATFYMLPKIHKDSQRPPGRPIVSSVGSMCERAGEYLDFFLQPIASSLPSFVRDSAHFIDLCGHIELPENFLLITCDVESLYSNIGHKEGIEAVTHFLDQNSSIDRGHDSFLLDLLTFVLHHNFFLFDRVYYLQKSGVAMGAKCAPAYANTFLGWWEEKFVYPLPAFATHVHAWLRFIDDIFILWKGTEEDCVEFFNTLNSNPYNIYLTYSFSASEITFLDLRIFSHGNGLATDLYRKPTATNSLLEFTSFHPWHTKLGTLRTASSRGVTRNVLSLWPIKGQGTRTRDHSCPLGDGVRIHKLGSSQTTTVVGHSFHMVAICPHGYAITFV